ncbi:MAG TPA: redoxin domain-containing protein [Candidatus Tectomicrobia bacterium]|nr:redoxin domain-containing protein [Candidatus Tectomicrobia bacterium]
MPAVNREGTLALGDYRGRSRLLLTLFRGLYCAFCRRHMVLLGKTAGLLDTLGVQTVGIVATAPERARRYLGYHAIPYAIGADPELVTHRAYGVPRRAMTPDVWSAVDRAAGELARELGVPVGPEGAYAAVAETTGYRPDDADLADQERHQAQFTGQFLIDMDGIVRWASVESVATAGRLAPETEILAAARRL